MCRKIATLDDGWCVISGLFSHEYGLSLWQYPSVFCSFHDCRVGNYRFLSLNLDFYKIFWTLQKLSLGSTYPLHVKGRFNQYLAKISQIIYM